VSLEIGYKQTNSQEDSEIPDQHLVSQTWPSSAAITFLTDFSSYGLYSCITDEDQIQHYIIEFGKSQVEIIGRATSHISISFDLQMEQERYFSLMEICL